MKLSSSQVRNLTGFGMPLDGADSYVSSPRNVQDISEILALSRSNGRKIVLRGSGKSYGDAALYPEAIGISFENMASVGHVEDGILIAEAGATLDAIWRTSLPQGYWPPVVTGTSFPTLSGALAMNVHGKNAFLVGTLGENIEWIEVLDTSGTLHRLRPDQPDFWGVIGGAGLVGIIIRAGIRMKAVSSGSLKVSCKVVGSWEEHFAAFAQAGNSDYMVSWVDLYSGGRGIFHSAVHTTGEGLGLNPINQVKTGRLFGILPRDKVYIPLKILNNPIGMRTINALKYRMAKAFEDGKISLQSHAQFHFLLDSVPGWEKSYDPFGLLQFQCFIPEDRALGTFKLLAEVQKGHGIISFLGVMKKHKRSKTILNYSVDGYSLAMDFKRAADPRPLQLLCDEMTKIVIESGGKLYLAKDSAMTADMLLAMHGEQKLNEFRAIRQKFDPENLLSSSLGQRLGLN
jgi:decaprenylphospho-beta-D-ribofuranose 2-oxidase